MLQCVAVCCSVLQCVAVCCSVLQCVAVCCSVLQCDTLQHTAAQYVGDVLMCLCASLTHLCVYVFHSSSQSLCLCLSCYVTAHGKRCMKLSSQRQDRRKIRCLLHVYNLHAWVSCACVEPVVSFPCVEPVFSMCRTCV